MKKLEILKYLGIIILIIGILCVPIKFSPIDWLIRYIAGNSDAQGFIMTMFTLLFGVALTIVGSIMIVIYYIKKR